MNTNPFLFFSLFFSFLISFTASSFDSVQEELIEHSDIFNPNAEFLDLHNKRWLQLSPAAIARLPHNRRLPISLPGRPLKKFNTRPQRLPPFLRLRRGLEIPYRRKMPYIPPRIFPSGKEEPSKTESPPEDSTITNPSSEDIEDSISGEPDTPPDSPEDSLIPEESPEESLIPEESPEDSLIPEESPSEDSLIPEESPSEDSLIPEESPSEDIENPISGDTDIPSIEYSSSEDIENPISGDTDIPSIEYSSSEDIENLSSDDTDIPSIEYSSSEDIENPPSGDLDNDSLITEYSSSEEEPMNSLYSDSGDIDGPSIEDSLITEYSSSENIDFSHASVITIPSSGTNEYGSEDVPSIDINEYGASNEDIENILSSGDTDIPSEDSLENSNENPFYSTESESNEYEGVEDTKSNEYGEQEEYSAIEYSIEEPQSKSILNSCVGDCNLAQGKGHCDTESGHCICSWPFFGVNCEQEHCTHSCGSHGQCNTNDGSCECSFNYYGSHCEKKRCPGDGLCSNHGRCTDNGVCICRNGYRGSFCESRLCSSDCGEPNQGSCDTHTGRCLCRYPYYGNSCHNKHCPQDCSHRGRCDNSTGTCSCPKDYYGDGCQFKYCPPCGSRGRCDKFTGLCRCDPPYTGNSCSLLSTFYLSTALFNDASMVMRHSCFLGYHPCYESELIKLGAPTMTNTCGWTRMAAERLNNRKLSYNNNNNTHQWELCSDSNSRTWCCADRCDTALTKPPEVFIVGAGSDYEFNDVGTAIATCREFHSELATESQLQEAYSQGMQVCATSWYRKGSWFSTALVMQTSVESCGNNAGVVEMNSETGRYGAACYGVKPTKYSNHGHHIRHWYYGYGSDRGGSTMIWSRYERSLEGHSLYHRAPSREGNALWAPRYALFGQTVKGVCLKGFKSKAGQPYRRCEVGGVLSHIEHPCVPEHDCC